MHASGPHAREAALGTQEGTAALAGRDDPLAFLLPLLPSGERASLAVLLVGSWILQEKGGVSVGTREHY